MISIKRGRERITKSNKERLEDSRFIFVGGEEKIEFWIRGDSCYV